METSVNSALKRSYLRHLLGAVIAAVLAVVIAHPDWLNFLGAAGAAVVVAVIPVLVKYLDPNDPEVGPSPPGD